MALAVGGGKLRGGNSRAQGESVTRADTQKERGDGNSLLATDSSIQAASPHNLLYIDSYAQHLQTSQPFIWTAADGRLTFLRKCIRGRAWPLRLEVAWLASRDGRVWGEGVTRAGLQKERDGVSPYYSR